MWFDLFSNNQINAPSLDFEWWTNTFKSSIKVRFSAISVSLSLSLCYLFLALYFAKFGFFFFLLRNRLPSPSDQNALFTSTTSHFSTSIFPLSCCSFYDCGLVSAFHPKLGLNAFSAPWQRFGRTVMVLAPWSNPVPFTRAWCLFEIYSTVGEMK